MRRALRQPHHSRSRVSNPSRGLASNSDILMDIANPIAIRGGTITTTIIITTITTISSIAASGGSEWL